MNPLILEECKYFIIIHPSFNTNFEGTEALVDKGMQYYKSLILVKALQQESWGNDFKSRLSKEEISKNTDYKTETKVNRNGKKIEVIDSKNSIDRELTFILKPNNKSRSNSIKEEKDIYTLQFVFR